MSVRYFLVNTFIESELLKDLIWHKFLICWHNLSLIYVSVLSSGKSPFHLFYLCHCSLKLDEDYAYDSYGSGM